MTLVLRIDNYDVLENGGPASITLFEKGAQIGRKGADWVLPDPARHISSHHFDITYSGGTYWLTDVSTNGTFLQGQRYRLDGAHPIKNGDRFTVGHYVIVAELSGNATAGSGMLQSPPTSQPYGGAPQADDDPWDFGGGALDPVNPMPAQRADPHHLDDIAQDFIPVHGQPSQPPSGLQQPPQPSGQYGGQLSVPPTGFGGQPGGAPQVPPVQPGPPPQTPPAGGPPPQVPPVQPGPPPQVAPVDGPPPQVAPVEQPPAQVPQPPVGMPEPPRPPIAPSAPTPLKPPMPSEAPRGAPAAQAAPATVATNDDVLRAFCQGAGLPPDSYAGSDTLALAHDLGKAVRVATTEIMTMLQDRAAVKQFTRGGERTMRSATGNNPLKFLPDSEQALEALFLKHRDGFMTGPDGFENALRDIRRHQTAVFAALQPALAEVLAGLSPEEIEEGRGSGLLSGSGKGKAWEAFVERWDAKADKGENGMLDAFLEAFAEAYARAASRADG